MGTTVEYNGVTLHNVVTREWSQEVRYDESNTDAVYHVFRMRFEGILHAGSEGNVWVSAGTGGTMPGQYDGVYRRILKPRSHLFVTVSDAGGAQTELFRCNPPAGDPMPGGPGIEQTTGHTDVDNGPKPKSLRVLQIIGATSLRVAFEIECAKLVCPQPIYTGQGLASELPVVLNNRWSVAEDMDDNYFLTRTITGKLRLSIAVATSKIDAKWLVIPGLEKGFRRTALDYTVDKTGLDCDYRITDRQVHTAAPWPATKMSVRHTQSTNDGIAMSSEVYVELEGPPAADKRLLFTRVIQVIDAKMNFAEMQNEFGTRFIPEDISFTDYIGESNRVEGRVRFRQHPGGDVNPAMMFTNLATEIGKPIESLPSVAGEPAPYDPQVSQSPAVYGYTPQGGARSPAVLMLLQCYLQMPCVDVHGIVKGSSSETAPDEEGESQEQYQPLVTEMVSGSIPNSPGDEWSQAAKNSLYTLSRVCTRYEMDECSVQLPRAASASAGGQATSRVFRLAPAQCVRTITVDVERAGMWPEIPPPDATYTDGELEGTLLRHWKEPHPPSLTADGRTRLYRITAHYVYAMNRAPLMTESFRVGVAPQTKYKKTDDVVRFTPEIVYANKDLGP